MNKQELINKYLGKEVHVIIRDPWHPFEGDGIVTLVDDAFVLHGTWGGLGAVLPCDSVTIIEPRKFKVEITETLQRVVEVEASSANDALDKVKDMYRNEEVVLDYNDFVGNDFEIYEED